MDTFSNKCFVCEQPLTKGEHTINEELNLPVCDCCKGTDKEKEAVEKGLDSLADGFVCGCI